MGWWIAIVSLLVSVLITFLYFYQNRVASYPDLWNLPSPPRQWLTGHALQLLAAAKTGKFSEQVFAWSQEYGPLMLLKVFRKPIIMVGKPSLVEYILTEGQNDGIFQRSPVFYHAYKDVFGVHIGNQIGSEWQWRRQAAAPYFRNSQFNQKLNAIVSACEQVISQLENHKGDSIEIDPLFVELTMGIIAHFFLGVSLDGSPSFEGEVPFNAQLLYKSLAVLEKHVLLQTSGRSRWFRYLPSREGQQYRQAHQHIQNILVPRITMALKIARPHQHESPPAMSPSFQESILVQLAKIPQHSKISLMAESRAFIFAGHDTTAHTLSFAVGELGLNPNVFQTARGIIDRVWERTGGITLEALKELVYVEAIAKESIRLHPVAASIPIVTTQDTELDGIKIPKGAGVEPFFLAAGRDPDMYPQPNKFQPERWLTSNDKFPTPILFGFSRGQHYCMGTHLALLEATVMLSLLIRHYDWELVNGHNSLVNWDQNLTIFPADRMPIRITKRVLLER